MKKHLDTKKHQKWVISGIKATIKLVPKTVCVCGSTLNTDSPGNLKKHLKTKKHQQWILEHETEVVEAEVIEKVTDSEVIMAEVETEAETVAEAETVEVEVVVEKVTCGCGTVLLEKNLKKHLETKKHKKWSEKNQSLIVWTEKQIILPEIVYK
jgi:quinol monooxygenase YgiN